MNVQLDATLIVQVTMQLDEAVDLVNGIERLNGYATPRLEELRSALLAGLVAFNPDLRATPRGTDEDTLGPCGCIDYHMADCPTVTDSGPPDPPDVDDDASESERRYAWGDR